MAKRKPVTRRVEYYPPAFEDIHHYASAVCRELGETVDAALDTPEFRRELANLIKIIASICAKHLTKHGKPLDNGHQ